jgi:hypothetical protein
MPGMAWMRSSLAAFLAIALPAFAAATLASAQAVAAVASTRAVAAPPAATKVPTQVPAPPAAGVTATVIAPKPKDAASRKADADAGTVTVHRCTDARGQVTLQDDPCPPGSREETRAMTRPKDPPVSSKAVKVAETPAMPQPELVEPEAAPRLPIPPPPMYKCTSYDGDERFSESYDPNPRCEPLVIYYPYPNQLTPQQALSCRWVEDSCVRLSDRAACARWIQMRKDAVSAATRAFSDTAAYRKSELERLTQIVNESCF